MVVIEMDGAIGSVTMCEDVFAALRGEPGAPKDLLMNLRCGGDVWHTGLKPSRVDGLVVLKLTAETLVCVGNA